MSIKFLLTANGITNKSIENTLLELNEKAFGDTELLYILTAQNPKFSDKSRMIKNLVEFQNLGFKSIDIIDIAIGDPYIYLEKIKKADIICFGGGNVLYLKTILKKTGLLEKFLDIFDSKIYIGISAGSVVLGSNLKGEKEKNTLQDMSIDGVYNGDEFNVFDFILVPHMNSPVFPYYSKKNLEKTALEINKTMYCLDDQSALKIVGKDVEIISEGEYLILNQ